MKLELGMDIIEAAASGKLETAIDIADAIFKEAARRASHKAHSRGLEVYDGRAVEERRPRKLRSGA